jgi:hypothetical protein
MCLHRSISIKSKGVLRAFVNSNRTRIATIDYEYKLCISQLDTEATGVNQQLNVVQIS